MNKFPFAIKAVFIVIVSLFFYNYVFGSHGDNSFPPYGATPTDSSSCNTNNVSDCEFRAYDFQSSVDYQAYEAKLGFVWYGEANTAIDIYRCLTKGGIMWEAGSICNGGRYSIGPGFAYPGDTFSIPNNNTDDFNYANMHVRVEGQVDNSNFVLQGGYRRVHIDSFDMPSSVNVGEQFGATWNSSFATQGSIFTWSGPISCDKNGSVSSNGTSTCTATGSGTAQLGIESKGPGHNGLINVNWSKSITINAPLTHLACQSNACVTVAGGGANTCNTNADCAPMTGTIKADSCSPAPCNIVINYTTTNATWVRVWKDEDGTYGPPTILYDSNFNVPAGTVVDSGASGFHRYGLFGSNLGNGQSLQSLQLTSAEAVVSGGTPLPTPTPTPVCVSNGSCSAPVPACGTSTTGADNCGNPCSRSGGACACVSDGSCSAPVPACGTTTTGTDNCGTSCSKTGPACVPGISCMKPDSAVRSCTGYIEWVPVSQPNQDSCRTYCNSNAANACEWNSAQGNCYVEFGSGCNIQGGFGGWYAGVSGASCACVSNGSCSAPVPACGTSTTGADNCGNPCSRSGGACACVSNGSCSAPVPACGTTTTGTDNCGTSCSKTGPVCGGPTPTPTPASTPIPTATPPPAIPPTINGLTISSPTVRNDDSTQYNITITSSDPTAGSNIFEQYIYINQGGENVGAYRGYLGWYDGYVWPGIVDYQYCVEGPGVGPGRGGWAGILAHEAYIRLVGCSVSASGNIRTTTFTVTFKTLFTTPVADNDISGLSGNTNGRSNGANFLNFQTDFGLSLITQTLSATLTANPNSGNSPLIVALTANTSGTAAGTSNYSFWWNCSNSTTSLATATSVCGVLPTPGAGSCATNASGYKCNAINSTTYPGIKEDVVWTNTQRVLVSPANSITKNSATEGDVGGTWDAQGVSQQTVTSGDAYVEFNIQNEGSYQIAGFGAGNPVALGVGDFKFGIFQWGSQIWIAEFGSGAGDWIYNVATAHNGDLYRVAIESGVVKYYQNGVLFYTSTRAPTYPLKLDALLNTYYNPSIYLYPPYPVDAFLNAKISLPLLNTYTSTSMAKVIVERGSAAPAEARALISVVSIPPTLNSVTTRVSDTLYCLVGVNATVEGTASDSGGLNITAYEVLIDNDLVKNPNTDFASMNPEWESGTVATNVPSGSLITAGPTTCNPAALDTSPQTQCQMTWNTTYRSWMRVKNSVNLWSSWTQMSQFCNGLSCNGRNRWTTPNHSFPSTNFTYAPVNPTVGNPATFTDATTYGPGSRNKSWSWNFGGGSPTPANTNRQGPYDVVFPSQSTYQVSLTATDDVGSCSITKPVILKKPLPKWIEVLPK